MSASIKDVAKSAGVSISTVSRVLNATGPVSEDTRQKVQAAVRKHQYVPNSNAQSLKITHSKNIALIVSGMTNPFFAPMISFIERQVALRGYTLLIEAVEGEQNEVRIALQRIVERKLCGMIFLGGTYDHTEEDFRQMGDVPRVLLTFTAEKTVNPSLFSSIIVDDVAESVKAVEYLIGLGHRQIAFFAKSPLAANTTGHRRLLGYRQALEAHGIPFNTSLVQDCEYSPSSGYSAMRRIMAGQNITAVYAGADTIAIGAAKAVLSAGLSVPGDVSVVGFDGIEMAEYYHPALDTILQPGHDMAFSSVEVLFDLIANKAENRHLVFECSLLKRGSSAKVVSL